MDEIRWFLFPILDDTSKRVIQLFAGSLDVFGLKPLERCNVDVCYESVELVDGILVVVTHASKTDANTKWNTPSNEKNRH